MHNCRSWHVGNLHTIARGSVFIALAVGLITVVLSSASAAIAPIEIIQTGGLHFQDEPQLIAISQPAQLGVTAIVAGDAQRATAVLTATAEVTVGCLSRDGNELRGQQETFTSQVSSETLEITSRRGGFSLETDPIFPSDVISCPKNQTPTIVSVTFSDITLTVTSNRAVLKAIFPDQSL
jgi:hypothetical protein